MRNQDVALLAFKGVALWIVASGLIDALEVALNWQALERQFAGMGYAAGSPSPTSLVWNALGAMLARSGVGVFLWLFSGRLARSVFPADDPPLSLPSQVALFRGAAFLVGLRLLADALPRATFTFALIARGGWNSGGDDLVPEFASLWVKIGLGLTLLRGGDWIRELVVSRQGLPKDDAAA